MFRKPLYILLSGIILTAISMAQTRVEMSLEDCIKYGLENNKNIKIASEKVKASRLKREEVNTTGLPSLSLQAGYTRLSEVDPFTISIPFGPTTQSFTVSPSILNNYSAKLTLTQPLFTGFKIDLNKDLSDQSIQAGLYDLEAEKSKLRYSIANAYWSLYKVVEGKKCYRSILKPLNSTLRISTIFTNRALLPLTKF